VYVNSDIILLDDFLPAVRAVPLDVYLMVGRRMDTEIDFSIEFTAGWPQRLRELALAKGRFQRPSGMDYFVFTPDGIRDIPPFAIGRWAWDNWIVHDAISRGVKVIDATDAILAIHQNHDYAHIMGREGNLINAAEVRENVRLACRSLWYSHRDAHLLLRAQPDSTGRRYHLTRNWLAYVKPVVRTWRRATGQGRLSVALNGFLDNSQKFHRAA
jgi:hypothetical protein